MMLSKVDNLVCLCRRSEEYQDHKVYTSEAIEDFEDFGQGFVLVDDLEEIDIGDGKVK
jgi:hypothetical protein